MSQPLMPRQVILKFGTAAIMWNLAITWTVQAQCHPETPCPCCADGMCYPKRDTWGNYITNWRPWPGQPVRIAPTPADEVLEDLKEQLPPFILPRPDQEDLRGPARPTRPAAPEGQPAAEGQPPAEGQAPVAQPPAGEQQAPALDEVPAPEEDLDLPGFGPQGTLQPLPRIEEGPPSLPQGLTQALISQGTAQANGSADPQSANKGRLSAGPGASNSSHYVTPTAGTRQIELTNPAAKNVQKTMDEELHHAIYYEAAQEGRK